MIDYGLGQSNIDHATGIRYGVISQHAVSERLRGEPQMITETTLLKFLDAGGVSPYQHFQWPLPTSQPGKWVRASSGPLGLCANGIHVCTPAQAVAGGWISAEAYTVEVKGGSLADTDKSCHRAGRLLERIDPWSQRALVLWAADCAEHVLHLYESKYPDDKRPRQAIEAARSGNAARAAYAAGAAADAARAAAGAARAAYAAGAARAAYAADAAYAAAAARAAARAAYAAGAARAAYAAAAAYAAERQWQTQRLLAYLNGEVEL